MVHSKEYFNEIAQEWDDMQNSFFSEQVREVAYSLAKIQANKSAADIGAGTGFITEGLLKEGIKVYAIDQSEKMLEKLKDKFAYQEHLTCLLGEGDSLPLDNNSVDYVFANMFLHHIANPFNTIKEMVRILKTDGKLVITDLDEHDFTFLKEEQYDLWMGFKRTQITKWFEQAGLTNISISCVGCNCSADSKESTQKASVSIFAAYATK